MEQDWIGILAVALLFGLLPLTGGIVLVKLRARRMDTLVKLVELGAPLDAETIKALSGGESSYKTDYKWSLIWLAIGIPVTLGLWVEIGGEEAVWGLIPVFVGIAYGIAGKLRLRESS